MSKLEELIAELCPDGVVFQCFGELCDYIRGVTYNKSKEASIRDEKSWKVLRANNITLGTNSLNFDDVKLVKADVKVKKEQMLYAGDILICAGSGSKEHVGKVSYISEDLNYSFGGFMAVIRCGKELNSRYLFHILTGNEFKSYLGVAINSATISNLNSTIMNRFRFPVPPLPVQNEIVRILDNFTELTAELKTQLAMELTARKKQYEYYRVKLLTFGDEIERVSIGDICDVLTGGEAPENTIKGDVSDESHPYPVFGNGKEVYGYTDSYRVDKDAVVISSIGANTGAVYYRKAFFTPIIRLKVIVPKTSEISNRYLFHAVSITSFSSKSSSVPNMNANDIKKAIIPLPPFEVQERLAYILDQFDAFCTDLNEGLPAEIAARTKQYEYYRDKLLTFPERT